MKQFTVFFLKFKSSWCFYDTEIQLGVTGRFSDKTELLKAGYVH